jgi:hypothetical protein
LQGLLLQIEVAKIVVHDAMPLNVAIFDCSKASLLSVIA